MSKTLTVRAGKTLKSNILHEKEKKKGERVIVNRTKGRRARLKEKKDDGSWANAGWVSMFSERGKTLMMQLEKSDYSIEDRMKLEAAQENKITSGSRNR